MIETRDGIKLFSRKQLNPPKNKHIIEDLDKTSKKEFLGKNPTTVAKKRLIDRDFRSIQQGKGNFFRREVDGKKGAFIRVNNRIYQVGVLTNKSGENRATIFPFKGSGLHQLTSQQALKARSLNQSDRRKYIAGIVREAKNKRNQQSWNKATREQINSTFIRPNTSRLKPANDNHPPERPKPTKSQSSQKQGANEKMASLRNRVRDRHQNRDKALKTSKDKKPTHLNNSRESLKARYGKPTEAQRGKVKSVKDRAKIGSNSSDRTLAKNKSTESGSGKKQGIKEKMASLRNRVRDRHQNRANTLKLSGEKRVTPTKTQPEGIKSRYGSSSESNRAKNSANQESKIRGSSESKKPRSSPTSKGDSKPTRGGSSRRRK